MKIIYDNEVDALYIQLRSLGPGQAENREISDGIIADYGPDGLLAGIEILNAAQVLGESKDQVILELAPARQQAA